MRQLRRILDGVRGAELGRFHGVASIRSYEDFRDAVPLTTYDELWPQIERMMDGEPNVLVRGRPKYFANSSGSSGSGRNKLYPITQAQIRQQRHSAADALFATLSHRRTRDFLSGYTLGLFPPLATPTPGQRTVVTSNPALMISLMPALARLGYLPRGGALTETDYDNKLDLLAHDYLDYDVRTLTGTTCWFAFLLERVRDAAQRRFGKALPIRAIWPNLNLLVGGGVAPRPYLPAIEGLIGDDRFSFVNTYNATEGGIFAATDPPCEEGMLIIPHRGVFFELLPIDSGSPSRMPLWEAQSDRTYELIVSTLSGLLAYRLGDLVRFPSLDPICVEFVGRAGGCLSTTQELTTHAEIEAATAEALAAAGAPPPIDFAVGAEQASAESSKPRYVLLAEFEKGASIDEARLADAFDRALQSRNRVYREHREKDVGILPARFSSLAPGAAARFMQLRRGANVQAKFPRIVDEAERSILEGQSR